MCPVPVFCHMVLRCHGCTLSPCFVSFVLSIDFLLILIYWSFLLILSIDISTGSWQSQRYFDKTAVEVAGRLDRRERKARLESFQKMMRSCIGSRLLPYSGEGWVESSSRACRVMAAETMWEQTAGGRPHGYTSPPNEWPQAVRKLQSMDTAATHNFHKGRWHLIWNWCLVMNTLAQELCMAPVCLITYTHFSFWHS